MQLLKDLLEKVDKQSIKGKDDKAKKSEYKLFKYSKLGSFWIRNLINIK